MKNWGFSFQSGLYGSESAAVRGFKKRIYYTGISASKSRCLHLNLFILSRSHYSVGLLSQDNFWWLLNIQPIIV
ncbi:hypothetical protein ASG14_15510 [Pedobacter sp. Leaf194]|nr:hypothetical protein ASG14_15510 [Pedobacter sp. Leaf194]